LTNRTSGSSPVDVGIIRPSSGTARRATIAIASSNDGAAVRNVAATTTGGNTTGGGPRNAFVASSFGGGGGAVVDCSGTPNMSRHSASLNACAPNTPNVDGKLNPPAPKLLKSNDGAVTVIWPSSKPTYFFLMLRIFFM
jgi:hypothetical protein